MCTIVGAQGSVDEPFVVTGIPPQEHESKNSRGPPHGLWLRWGWGGLACVLVDAVTQMLGAQPGTLYQARSAGRIPEVSRICGKSLEIPFGGFLEIPRNSQKFSEIPGSPSTL